MKLYASAYLVFGVQVPRDLKDWMETGVLNAFDRENDADLGYLTVGNFGDNRLYLTAFCESASPNEPKRQTLRGGTREQRMIWRRQLEKFLRQHGINEHGEIGMWLLADLDN